MYVNLYTVVHIPVNWVYRLRKGSGNERTYELVKIPTYVHTNAHLNQ